MTSYIKVYYIAYKSLQLFQDLSSTPSYILPGLSKIHWLLAHITIDGEDQAHIV
jgi:hypothetical protein